MSRSSTTQITVSNDWTQITDGNTTEVIQFFGVVHVCRSPTKPDKNTPGLRYDSTTLTVTAPDIAWIRAAYTGDIVTVCIW
ncbi:hypothetical protein O3231_003690 [Salmonella enterica]|nr:hypothetical protein [Salmonella enterica]